MRLCCLLTLGAGLYSGARAEDSNLDKILSEVQKSLKKPTENRPSATPEPKALRSSEKPTPAPIPESFKGFIDTMWRHQISNSPDDWASDFASSVNYGYASSGSVSRSFVRNDRAKLIRRYPERNYQMIDIGELKHFGDEISGVWRFRYSYRGAKLASGTAIVHFTAQWRGDRWQFVLYSEDVQRD